MTFLWDNHQLSSFFGQEVSLSGSNRAIIVWDLSQKHYLKSFPAQSRESKLIAYNSDITKLLFLIFLGFGKRHLNTIELSRCVVHVFCGLMTVCLKNPRNFILLLKTLWRYILLNHCSYAFDRPPSIFSVCFRCIYFHLIFFKIMVDSKNSSIPWFWFNR